MDEILPCELHGRAKEMAQNEPPEAILEMWESFMLFDKDKNGQICQTELESVLQSLGQNPTKQEVQAMIKDADFSGDDMISFEEFVVMILEKKAIKTPEQVVDELNEAFKVFDKDGNGYINAEELRTMMATFGQNMSEEEIDAMIEAADTNNDQQIQIEEFVKLMSGK
jgi:calmodulin